MVKYFVFESNTFLQALVPMLLCEARGEFMRLIATALLFAAMALPAGDPPGLFVWKSAELKGFSKSLSPKIDAKKVATQTLPAVGNYSFMVAHREGSGEAEYHETQAD